MTTIKITDPVIEERRAKRQTLVFVMLTILTAVVIVCDLLSDIFLRPRHQTAAYHVVNIATDYDLQASAFVLAWIIVAVRVWRRR